MADPGSGIYQANLALNRLEHRLGRVRLTSYPTYLSLVLGNRCNIDCPYCYQAKNEDSLLGDPEIGPSLRRELQGFYPFLSTFRVQGGEVFMIRGFRELVEEVATGTRRPLISISTNGTLVNDAWAELMVRTPFQSVTFSVDGATPATYERLRRGAQFETVIENIRRLQAAKSAAGSVHPTVDLFFLLMRSNFREVPQFLDLAADLGIRQVSFQTPLIDHRNLAREPWLGEERIEDEGDVRELHAILRQVVPGRRHAFDQLHFSGLQPLFQRWGLSDAVLADAVDCLYPDRGTWAPESEEVPPAPAGTESAGGGDLPDPVSAEDLVVSPSGEVGDIELCPNPWTMMYVTESGDVHTCFMARPVGSIYETPLLELWNAPQAVAARNSMLLGRYLQAGCSPDWCGWREGKLPAGLVQLSGGEMSSQFRRRVDAVLATAPEASPEPGAAISAVRRNLAARSARIRELEANLVDLCQKNQLMLDEVDHRNQRLTARIAELERQVAGLGAPGIDLTAEATRTPVAPGGLRSGVRRLRSALKTLLRR